MKCLNERHGLSAVCFLFLALSASALARGQEIQVNADPLPGTRTEATSIDWDQLNLWTPSGRAKTFVDAQTRAQLKQIEIADRPNRLFHFYGNAVRRRHHGRGAEPRPIDRSGEVGPASQSEATPAIHR